MVAQVAIHSNLRLLGALILDKDHDEFPANPSPGTLLVKGMSLYAYLTVNGYQTWFPIVRNIATTYVHTQVMENAEWTINHGMDTAYVWYQVQNGAGVPITPIAQEQINTNTLKLIFAAPVLGVAILVGASALEVTEIKTELITVGPNVTIDSSGVEINGSPVVTAATLDTSVENKVTEISYTQEQLYTRPEVEAIVQAALNAFKSTLYVA